MMISQRMPTYRGMGFYGLGEVKQSQINAANAIIKRLGGLSKLNRVQQKNLDDARALIASVNSGSVAVAPPPGQRPTTNPRPTAAPKPGTHNCSAVKVDAGYSVSCN